MAAAPPIPILDSAAIRRIETGYAELPLMHRAGLAAARRVRQLLGHGAARVLVLAGPGNNGGDAFEVASELAADGDRVSLLCLARGDSAETQIAWQRWQATGVPVLDTFPDGAFDLVVDGVFGLGLKRAPDGVFADWIERSNRLDCQKLALDMPSGLDADTGRRFGVCIRATETATFIALKPGLVTGEGVDYAGRVRVFDLELPVLAETGGRLVQKREFLPALQPRPRDSHKGHFGDAWVIGGAPGMRGAALLAGRAARALGAGRVFVVCLGTDAPALDLLQPELMFVSPSSLSHRTPSAVAIGPGLGTSDEAAALLRYTLSLAAPVVLDADALNLLAHEPDLARQLRARAAPALLTPHPLEAARLLHCDRAAVSADRVASARALANSYRSAVVLKGAGSVCATPDGRWWINSSGNPALASAGMGDVLSGLMLALLAQGVDAEDSLLAAVHLHGAAADDCEHEAAVGLSCGELIAAARRRWNHWLAETV